MILRHSLEQLRLVWICSSTCWQSCHYHHGFFDTWIYWWKIVIIFRQIKTSNVWHVPGSNAVCNFLNILFGSRFWFLFLSGNAGNIWHGTSSSICSNSTRSRCGRCWGRRCCRFGCWGCRGIGWCVRRGCSFRCCCWWWCCSLIGFSFWRLKLEDAMSIESHINAKRIKIVKV